MRKNLLKIALGLILLCFIAGYAFILNLASDLKLLLFFWVMAGLAFLCFLYIFIRITVFNTRLIRLFRTLISGNYEAGLNPNRLFKDEIETLIQQINKFLEHLRTYDRLRAERIAFNSRALNLIYENINEGIAIADMEKETFLFNPAARALFEVKQESFSFDSLRTQERNRQIVRMFIKATEIEKVPQEGKVIIQLPIQSGTAVRELFVKIIPLKDKEEKVKLSLIFISAVDLGNNKQVMFTKMPTS